MKKILVFIVFTAAILITSCSKNGADLENSIPDESFAVVSMQPKQIFDKGQISTLEFLQKEIDDVLLKEIIKNPLESGIEMNAYAYAFAYFKGGGPLIGFTVAIANPEKFDGFMEKLMDKSDREAISVEGYSMVIEDDEAAMAWNKNQMIFLVSTDEKYSSEAWKAELLGLYDLPKEEAITSMVDFNDFSGKMKDLNLWFTGDEIMKILEKMDVLDNVDFDLPVELTNNYGQVFADFQKGAMYVHQETHFSDDVTKATEAFLVAKDELNKDMLKLAPGNDLLMAMAYSVEFDKMVNMIKRFSPPDMDGVSGKIEQATGVPGDEILESLSGDLVIAVNGAKDGATIPVEVMIGIGLDDESLQEKMMGQVQNMATVEEDGDFFMINANGIELYSGIVDGIWVITNAIGYKDAVTGKGLDNDLLDSKFGEYANGSMGMYVNMDVSSYPAALQSMATSQGSPEMLEMLTSTLTYLGIQASNSESDMTLKTAVDDENSLYTILKLLEKAN